MKHKIYQQIEEQQLLPLYTVTKFEYLYNLEQLLIKHDIKFIEITYRSEFAGAAIKQLAKSEQLIVGAGTVRSVEDAADAITNGAKFIVTPTIIPSVVEYCIKMDVPIFPGVATPHDLQCAADYGITIVKFFPADIFGGLKAIEALSGPFYEMKFLPTGGINLDNFLEYVNNENIIAVGGSFIVSESTIIKDEGQTADRNLCLIKKQLLQNNL